MRLKSKTCVITGATGAIGKATAKLFHEHGANLCLIGRDSEKLEDLKNEFESLQNILIVQAEAKDEVAIREAISRTYNQFGALDAVFANGGTEGIIKPLTEYSHEEFNEILHVNVTGVWLLMKYAVPLMQKNGGGSFVATSSGAGVVGFNGLCPYAASKHAVIGMMKTACLEFGSEGIRLNSLAPGPIDNRMMQSLHDQLNPDDPNSVREFVTESIPMRRYGSNQEIANLALFLASDESSFCNGAVFLSDGGFTAG